MVFVAVIIIYIRLNIFRKEPIYNKIMYSAKFTQIPPCLSQSRCHPERSEEPLSPFRIIFNKLITGYATVERGILFFWQNIHFDHLPCAGRVMLSECPPLISKILISLKLFKKSNLKFGC